MTAEEFLGKYPNVYIDDLLEFSNVVFSDGKKHGINLARNIIEMYDAELVELLEEPNE